MWLQNLSEAISTNWRLERESLLSFSFYRSSFSSFRLGALRALVVLAEQGGDTARL